MSKLPGLGDALRARVGQQPQVPMGLEADRLGEEGEMMDSCRCPKCGYQGPSEEFQEPEQDVG